MAHQGELEAGDDRETKILALTIDDREAMLRVLEALSLNTAISEPRS